jgi:D-sedoheptulose 7-phosphate isomerase
MSTTHQSEAAIDKTTESFRDKVIRKCGESIEMKEKFFTKYAESLEAMSRAMAERFQQDGRLFVMGNGGSLCDALHMCVEFNDGYRHNDGDRQ